VADFKIAHHGTMTREHYLAIAANLDHPPTWQPQRSHSTVPTPRPLDAERRTAPPRRRSRPAEPTP
jgi:hypothetical protein